MTVRCAGKNQGINYISQDLSQSWKNEPRIATASPRSSRKASQVHRQIQLRQGNKRENTDTRWPDLSKRDYPIVKFDNAGLRQFLFVISMRGGTLLFELLIAFAANILLVMLPKHPVCTKNRRHLLNWKCRDSRHGLKIETVNRTFRQFSELTRFVQINLATQYYQKTEVTLIE